MPTKDRIKQGWNDAIDYNSFIEQLDYFVQSKRHSGDTNDQRLVHYTALNQRRIKRWEKTLKVPEALSDLLNNITQPLNILIITESWCGDAAPSLPVFWKLVQLNELLSVRILYRDQNLPLIEDFLTRGARSIPKVLFLNHALELITTWGPRSKKAAKMVEDYKNINGKLDDIFKEQLQKFYNTDKGGDIFDDLETLFRLEIIGNGAYL